MKLAVIQPVPFGQIRRLLALLTVVLAAVSLRGETNVGQTTLVWVSLDGIRPDYLDRAETPFFDRLAAEGAFSRELQPLFPTLTFAAHASKATGAPVEKHGIPGNAFYDSRRDRSYGYPNLPWLLEAEPLWNTAARQGVVALVFGWPLSHRQTGKNQARYFDPAYNREESDRQRLFRLLDTWRKHTDPEPLRLLMGYGVGPDTAGHRYGPDAEETARAMENADRLMARFEEGMLALWNARRQPGDALLLFVTSDHGMSPVHTLVNLRLSAGLPARDPVRLVTGGNIGHLFLNRIEDPGQRENRKQEILARLRTHEFNTVYERETLPARWRYAHPRRTGDLVVVLPRGYAFNGRIRRTTQPVAEIGEPLGMHGYCAEDNPEMITVAFFQRYPEPLGGRDLGRFTMDRLHATAAQLIGIEPGPDANPQPVPLVGGRKQ